MPPFRHASIATVRNYWDARPCNIRHSHQPLGSREYFDEVEAKKYLVEPHIPAFANFEHWCGKRVLEVGCGIGTDTMRFARAGALVTAVDLSAESLKIARTRAEVFGLTDKITFVNADAEHLNEVLPPQTFDLIYSFGVLHHTPHPDRALAALRPFAGPGTVVKLMFYYRRSWKVFWILAKYGKFQFWKLDALIAMHSEAQTGCPVTFSYSRKSARALLRRSGFELTEASIDHIFPYSIPEYRNHIYKRVWYFRYMPPVLFRLLETHFGWHLCLTARPL